MNQLIPYAMVALVCLGAGALLNSQCSEPPKPETIVRIDTVKGETQTVTITRPVVKEKIVYRDMPVPTDDSPCWALLKVCYMDQDSMAQQLWYLSELETEAEISDGGITGRIGWSTPRFLENKTQGFFYDLQSTITETNVYPEYQRTFWDRFGYGPILGLGIGTRGPDAFVGVGGFFDLR